MRLSLTQTKGKIMLRLINQFSLLNVALHAELKSIVDDFNLNVEKKKQRRQLLKLESHLLNDIGISYEQAMDEGSQ